MSQPKDVPQDLDADSKASSALTNDIEEICRRFEQRVLTDSCESIESLIDGWQEPERSKLLSELIAIEVRLRDSDISSSTQRKYLQRFPNQLDAVNEAFSDESLQTILVNPSEETLNSESTLQELRFLAQGGLGQIYIGEDAQLRREAAVKLIRSELADNEKSCKQFRIEAEVTGRLAHPGIPTVYSLGKSPLGRLFYAMQYVHGTGLDRLIRRHHKVYRSDRRSQLKRFRGMQSSAGSGSASGVRSGSDSNVKSDGRPIGPGTSSSMKDQPTLELRELLQIFISICQTIGYAHRRGILHRDIKPSNIIHGKFGETVVIDWGLALPIGRQGVFKDDAEQSLNPYSDESEPRASAGFAGTPAYMSPEQATGNLPLTPASDIFSLGATLFHILTGQPPYKGESAREVRNKAMAADFDSARELCPNLPVELEAICHHAMNQHISERYQTTGELITDLNNYLADRPISVLPESPLRVVSRWMRRNIKKVLALMLCLLTVALGVTAYALVERSELQQQQTTINLSNQMRLKESELRHDALLMAADLAARTLSNKIDVMYRMLEQESNRDALVSVIKDFNAAESSGNWQNEMTAVQSWLNDRVSKEYSRVEVRSWIVMSQTGTTIARFPEFDDRKRVASIGRNYAFRDYFHGSGSDLPPNWTKTKPVSHPHNSAATVSSIDGAATVVFSVPVFDNETSTESPIGIIAICVNCGDFLDLKVQQPEHQKLILVESRGYPLMTIKWNEETQVNEVIGEPLWGAGTVLHHENLKQRAAAEPDRAGIFRVGERMLNELRSDSEDRNAKLIPQFLNYYDPVDGEPDDGQNWVAAYAPVVIESRLGRPNVANTGWCVIVQQEVVTGDD